MSEVNDTVAEPVTETEPSVDNGTVDEPIVEQTSEVTEEQTGIDKAAYEEALHKASEAEKELNKARQELNLRRNQEEKAKLDGLSDKERADALQERLDAIDAEKAEQTKQQEAEEFRKEILGRFAKEVQEAAADINLWWDNPQTLDEAEQQLTAKAEKLAARIGAPKSTDGEEESGPEIHANNPAMDASPSELERLQGMGWKEMRKILPKADSR